MAVVASKRARRIIRRIFERFETYKRQTHQLRKDLPGAITEANAGGGGADVIAEWGLHPGLEALVTALNTYHAP